MVNRAACVETHLFHDRLMRIGPATLGPGSSLGPYSLVLPDTAPVSAAGRFCFAAGSYRRALSWHDAPVASA